MSQGRNSKIENSPEKKEEKTIRPNVEAQRDSTENQGDTEFVKSLDTNKLLSCRFYWDQFRVLPNTANTNILQVAERTEVDMKTLNLNQISDTTKTVLEKLL